MPKDPEVIAQFAPRSGAAGDNQHAVKTAVDVYGGVLATTAAQFHRGSQPATEPAAGQQPYHFGGGAQEPRGQATAFATGQALDPLAATAGQNSGPQQMSALQPESLNAATIADQPSVLDGQGPLSGASPSMPALYYRAVQEFSIDSPSESECQCDFDVPPSGRTPPWPLLMRLMQSSEIPENPLELLLTLRPNSQE